MIIVTLNSGRLLSQRTSQLILFFYFLDRFLVMSLFVYLETAFQNKREGCNLDTSRIHQASTSKAINVENPIQTSKELFFVTKFIGFCNFAISVTHEVYDNI